MKKVVFTEEAEQDLREAVSWYESQKKGIGKNLANEVIEKVQKLSLKPDSYSADHTGLRKTSLKSFPYIIYFLVKLPVVLILAVWHKSRLKAEVDKRAGSLNPSENEGSQQRQV